MRKPIPKSVRKAVLGRFAGLCGYCGVNEATCIDHVISVRDHHHRIKEQDYNREENLMPACASCNNYKGVWDVEWFRRELSEQVDRARKNSINFRLAERFLQVYSEPKPIIFHFERKKP